MQYRVRKAHVQDVGPIYELLKSLAKGGLLLPRSFANIYESLQTFFVAEDGLGTGTIMGIGALQVAWEDLGEVRSLAVRDEYRGQGIGQALTLAVEKEAWELGIRRTFALTYVPEFFVKLGYRIVGLDALPQKIWAVCFNCVHYPDCKEIAVVKDFAR
ncbi:MAG: N-acetyltransferase [Deltaproteobacteria bacterium]|jgi:amino-acid N-acetyltransferase|nr:N-acetyltransferase [Deltaproteobacteria bacterium]